MKINHIIKAIILSGFLTGLCSCDDVKPDDRYIDCGEITVERAVLLEDFTGQQCLNCPQAHKTIKELEAQYGEDKVIAVSIHCGEFGYSKTKTNFSKGNVGLMTEEGNAILETYGITSFPMGSINMGAPLTYPLWATAVREALSAATDIDLDIKVEYTPGTSDSNTGTIDINAEILSGSARTADIQFWVIEDGIVAIQKDGNNYVYDYVHDGVFRGQVLPGVKGESIALAKGIKLNKEASIETRWNEQEHWVPENLSIVAFVSDGSGVLQVTKVPVISNDSSEDNEEIE